MEKNTINMKENVNSPENNRYTKDKPYGTEDILTQPKQEVYTDLETKKGLGVKNNVSVLIKKLHKDAVIPKYATDGSACFDLTAVERNEFTDGLYIEYKTGLAFEIPTGYVGLLYPRSSVSKTHLILANSVGVIDSDYRGEISFRFKNVGNIVYNVGERIGQMMIIPNPQVNLIEVEELSNTDRGTGGYGSTGK